MLTINKIAAMNVRIEAARNMADNFRCRGKLNYAADCDRKVAALIAERDQVVLERYETFGFVDG